MGIMETMRNGQILFGIFMVITAVVGLLKVNNSLKHEQNGVKQDKLNQQMEHLTRMLSMNGSNQQQQQPQFINSQKRDKKGQMNSSPLLGMTTQMPLAPVKEKSSFLSTIGKSAISAVVFFVVIRLLQFLF